VRGESFFVVVVEEGAGESLITFHPHVFYSSLPF